ncbi:MAG: hypothetical protein ABFD46_04140 [Armatimonadota bacterium]
MKIISVRRGFTSDHSSTSYEFAAIDRPLDDEAQDSVASLSRRAEPTERTVEFVYNVDGYDIPGGWKPLMRDYYDVMYSNDYDWVTLAMAFNAPKEQQEEIANYEFDGGDNLGVSVSVFDSRIIVAINCMLDSNAHYELTKSRRKRASGDKTRSAGYMPRDPLLNLLAQVRKQLMEGDYRTLYSVWEEYGEDEEELDDEKPPVPPEKPDGDEVVNQLRELLTSP